MAIFEKPFLFSEMLRRTIFKGRPNFFNAKDFNKELLIIHSFIEEFNKVTAVTSDIKFTVSSFSESLDDNINIWTRAMNISWISGEVMYKGVKFQILGGGITDFIQTYAQPDSSTSPKRVKPPTYIVLTAELDTVTYADNPTLCGIQSDEVPSSVPTVDVEQYTNAQIQIVSDVGLIPKDNLICVLAVIHPRYTVEGDEDGFGFLYYTLSNKEFIINNGTGNSLSAMSNNEALFEYLLERVTLKLTNVLNERQLVRRFNFADLENAEKARNNLGLSNLINYRQLVQDENLNDLTDKALARFNLHLGNAATANIGSHYDEVAPGDILPVGAITLWSGSPSAIPEHWALCNGDEGTPNLIGKFVVGFDTGQSEFDLVGKTGGVKSITLTEQMIPKHQHSFSGSTDNDGAHEHSVWAGNGSAGNGFDKGSDDDERFYAHPNNENTSKHTHNFSGVTSYFGGDSDGNTKAFGTLPPYYVLCYIMFKGITIEPPEPLELPEPLTYPNFSTPDSQTDGGYANYIPIGVGSSNGETVGSGIILTNPK